MSYFLIKQWNPDKGQSSEKPSCMIGSGPVFEYPLTEKVKSYFCYNSRKRAENYAAKIWSTRYKTEIYEVPGNMIEEYKYDKELGYVKQS